MYKIVFKGQVGEEFVDTLEGQELSEAWEENRLPNKVKINGNLYESSSIKAVISGFTNPDKSEKGEEVKKMMRDMWSEHRELQTEALALSPEKRAQRTGLAEMLYTNLCGRPMSDEIKKEVIAHQTKFFEEHPDFSIAKPTCYKHIFRDLKRYPEYSMGNAVQSAALNLAERVIANVLPEK